MRVLDDYAQQDQDQTRWCWAAVACSVADYLRHGNWTQCTLVQAVLGKNGCCSQPKSCNEMDSLADALRATGSLGEHRESAVDLQAVQRQIDLGLPIGFRIVRDDRTAHVMVIVGYDERPGRDCRLEIRDPWDGPDTVPFGVLAGSIYKQGRWSDTYFAAT